MTILHMIEQWLTEHDIVTVPPPPLPPIQELTMTEALIDVRHHVEEMHAINRRLEERVAIAERIAMQQAIAHGMIAPESDQESHPK